MRKTILILDDNEDLRMMYSILVEAHHSAKKAANGRKAVEAFREGKIDLVFMDMNMPEMDGEQAMAKMIEMDKDAKVVINSGDIGEETARRLIRAGAKAVLKKPVSVPMIQKVLEKVMAGESGIIITDRVIHGIGYSTIFEDQ